MKNADFDALMRALEMFHHLQLPRNHWGVIRVDGRAFSSWTDQYQKPFDPRIHAAMIDVAAALLRDLSGLYAYTQSDEASVLVPPDWTLFDRELEKMVSIAAGLASATWVRRSASEPWGPRGHFDARVWVGEDTTAVLDYFRWRMSDCVRHAIQSTAFWHLRAQGQSARRAATQLHGQTSAQMAGWLREQGLDLEGQAPEFQRGSGLHWTTMAKEGYNPISKETVWTTRRTITICRALPEGTAYANWLRQVCPALEEMDGHNEQAPGADGDAGLCPGTSGGGGTGEHRARGHRHAEQDL